MTFLQTLFSQSRLEKIGLLLAQRAGELLLLCIGFFLLKLLSEVLFNHTIVKTIQLSRRPPARQKTLIKLSHNLMVYCQYFLLLYGILSILGLPVSSLLAGAGLTGLALGLGAQGFLSDMVNGFFILFENQFDVGDSVQLGTVKGTISSVGIRTTQVRDFDGTLHFIPNRNITIVSNKSRGDMRAQIDLPVTPQTPIADLEKLVNAVNLEHQDQFSSLIGQAKIVGLVTKNNGQLVYRIEWFTKNGQEGKIYSEFYYLYQEACQQAGIILATSPVSHDNPLPTSPSNPNASKSST